MTRDDVFDLLANVDSLKYQAKVAEEVFRQEAAKWVAEGVDDEITDRFNDLYWNTTATITPIANALNITIRQLLNLVEPIGSGVNCVVCDAELMATSRQDLRDIVGPRSCKQPCCDNCHKLIGKQLEHERCQLEKQNRDKLELWRKHVRGIPYTEYLKTTHWKKTARNARYRANFKCQLCGSGGRLNVHHKTYERLGEERRDDLIVLCEDCHAKFHEIGGEK